MAGTRNKKCVIHCIDGQPNEQSETTAEGVGFFTGRGYACPEHRGAKKVAEQLAEQVAKKVAEQVAKQVRHSSRLLPASSNCTNP